MYVLEPLIEPRAFALGNSQIRNFWGSSILHKLLSGLFSRFIQALPMCQPPFLCFNSFAPFVIFIRIGWMKKLRLGEVKRLVQGPRSREVSLIPSPVVFLWP